MGRHPKFGPWSDTHVKVEGPAVQLIQFYFVQDWYWAANRIPALNWQMHRAAGGNEDVLLIDFSRSRTVTIEDYTRKSFFFKLAVRPARLLAPIL